MSPSTKDLHESPLAPMNHQSDHHREVGPKLGKYHNVVC